tara:strand:- start:56 stop:445 length:390 start_codon:yes stop_codon:yes gene_type:complete
MSELDKIIIRIKELFSVQQDQEVAKILGISRASLANHKIRKTLPFKEIINLCKNNKKDINLIFGLKTEHQSINNQNTKFTLEEIEMLKDDLINQLKINQQLMAENIQLREKLLELGGVKAKRPGFLKKK